MPLDSSSLRRNTGIAPELGPPDGPKEVQYLGSVMGPGLTVGPQGVFRSLDELVEFVRDNVDNGATVTVMVAAT